jgi:dTDP-4-dehydrorhamnose 3,5-epimerase
MPFEFTPQHLEGVVLIRPRVFGDERGCFFESYRASDFHAAGIRAPFVQDNVSVSKRGVLRGIHYQLPPRAQGKLVWVAAGAAWDVCVDLRRRSPTFGRWFGVTLSAENRLLAYVPPGFGHGFVALSDQTCFAYKCTQEYDAGAERGIRWDDPTLAIDWPTRDVTVSARDARLPTFTEAGVFEAPLP